jgi:hypothetical protein
MHRFNNSCRDESLPPTGFKGYPHSTSRVARWFSFKPKIPIWENFGGSCNGYYWYILWPFGLFTAIGNILWPFGIFYGLFWYIFPHFGILYQDEF